MSGVEDRSDRSSIDVSPSSGKPKKTIEKQKLTLNDNEYVSSPTTQTPVPSKKTQVHLREFNARELDYIVTAITTGRQLERLADAIAEAISSKLSRYQKLELDAQFIADAVMKRLDEERQVSRIVLELMRGGLENEVVVEEPKAESTEGSISSKSSHKRKRRIK